MNLKNELEEVTYYYQGICPETGELLRLPRTRLAEKIAQELMTTITNPEGKMYGVLLGENAAGELEILKAFSGQGEAAGWVPSLMGREKVFLEEKRVLQLLETIKQEIISLYSIPESEFYKQIKADFTQELQALHHQHQIHKQERDFLRTSGNLTPEELEKLNNLSRREKRERKQLKQKQEQVLKPLLDKINFANQRIIELKQQRKNLSKQLQELLYQSYCLNNFSGQSLSLAKLMGSNFLPTGTGECCAPKLLNYAAIKGLKPIAMAEFWWGESNRDKQPGEFYGACQERCQPLMGFLLSGLHSSLKIIYEDEGIIAVNKPPGLLSVAGRYQDSQDSVINRFRRQGKNLIPVHRLDQETSGILLLAKNSDIYRLLSSQFQQREVKKTYEALLSGISPQESGIIDLPLWGNPQNRPYQSVDWQRGKPSQTYFQVLGKEGNYSRLEFIPLTGRTHQIRVHSQQGLGIAILGDRLYSGIIAERLYLHARELSFRHPTTKTRLDLIISTPF
jgi:tRNA pseudouridine32 synthase/23S rRNA pseudouridine746 synthase